MDFIEVVKETQSEEKVRQFNEFISCSPTAEELFSHESFFDMANFHITKINN